MNPMLTKSVAFTLWRSKGGGQGGHVPWAPVFLGGAKSAERAFFWGMIFALFTCLFVPSAPSPQGAWFVSTPAAGRQVWPSVLGSKTIAV